MDVVIKDMQTVGVTEECKMKADDPQWPPPKGSLKEKKEEEKSKSSWRFVPLGFQIHK